MASRSEQRAQDQATQQRRDAACADLIAHAAHDGDMFDDTVRRGIAVGVLSALVEAIEGERDDITELRRKGWQTKAREHDAALPIILGWRDALVVYTPPKPIEGPKVTDTTDPQGIPVSARAGSTAELDARLADAFGPMLAPVRHIRTAIERPPSSPGFHDADTAYGALCNATDGSWTHRGGANCGTCIATYDAEHGPYTGPVAYTEPARVVVEEVAPGVVMHDTTTPTEVWTTQRRDEPVTPAVAAAIRAEVEAENAMDTSALERINALPDTTVTAAGMSTTADLVQLPFVDPTPTTRPRMTLAEVREHGIARRRGAEHRSVSQIEGISDCGTRYAISDLERPAWWNVGGKALHRAVETLNRTAAGAGAFPAPGTDPNGYLETLFLRALDAEIADQHAATPQFPMDTWRAGKKGSEHYDFWRVEGPVMVQRWVSWLSGMLADGWTIADHHAPDGPVPVIEYRCELNVGLEVPDLSIIDLALLHPSLPETGQPCLLIIDIKAGASAPKSTFQLGVYGWALLAAGIAGFTPAPDLNNIRGAYWRARTGEAHPAYPASIGWPVLRQHQWPDVVQRFRDGDALDRAGIYTPNVTSFCGGCGVRDLCPAQGGAS